MNETETPKKKGGAKRPGTCTVQSLELVSETIDNLTGTLDARVCYVVAAAIAKFATLDITEQVQLVQDARVAYANSVSG